MPIMHARACEHRYLSLRAQRVHALATFDPFLLPTPDVIVIFSAEAARARSALKRLRYRQVGRVTV